MIPSWRAISSTNSSGLDKKWKYSYAIRTSSWESRTMVPILTSSLVTTSSEFIIHRNNNNIHIIHWNNYRRRDFCCCVVHFIQHIDNPTNKIIRLLMNVSKERWIALIPNGWSSEREDPDLRSIHNIDNPIKHRCKIRIKHITKMRTKRPRSPDFRTSIAISELINNKLRTTVAGQN